MVLLGELQGMGWSHALDGMPGACHWPALQGTGWGRALDGMPGRHATNLAGVRLGESGLVLACGMHVGCACARGGAGLVLACWALGRWACWGARALGVTPI